MTTKFKYIMNEKYIMIEDTGCWVYKLPNFISKCFVKTYTIQGAVYVKKHGIDEKPVFYSETIKGLEILKIITTSEKRANNLSFEYFNKKYPQYGNFIKFIK